MDMKMLQNINRLQELNEETAEALTEPIQPMYVALKPEQYNALVKHTLKVGEQIVRDTDLISRLPNQQDMDELMTETVERHLRLSLKAAEDAKADTVRMMDFKMIGLQNSLTSMMRTEISDMRNTMKMRDLTTWKLRLKWTAAGAMLPLLFWGLRWLLGAL